MKPLRAAYEAIADAGIAVASGNPSLLVHKHIDAAKEAIKQAGEERRGLLEALKELTAEVKQGHAEGAGSEGCKVCQKIERAEKAIAQAQEGKG